jgi:nitrite reductase (NADH) large subunit
MKHPESASTRTVVVVGNGMVCQRFCERLLAYSDAFRLVVFGEEPRPAYDRVKLTSYYEKASADELLLADLDWYRERGIELHLNERVTAVDTQACTATTDQGSTQLYDILVFASGSAAFVPPLKGVDKPGVFVYRTIEDLDAIRNYAKHCKHATVMGGGLLGLEAAKAVFDMGLATDIIEVAPRLMPRQLDSHGGALLKARVEALGPKVRCGFQTDALLGEEKLTGILQKDGSILETEMLVISAGIRPRDELARAAGVKVGERGGIVIDDQLTTSVPNVFAIGECALHRNFIYGLIAPGWDMADVLAKHLSGREASFQGGDLSTKLKLLGVDVASFGDAFADERDAKTIVFQDLVKGVYKKIVINADCTQLLGGMLVGDADDYSNLVAVLKSGGALPENPETLVIGSRDGSAMEITLSDDAQVCSCNNVSKGAITGVVASGQCATLDSVKTCTKAGTACGGCVPLVTNLVNAELRRMGAVVKNHLCEHFQFSRQELHHIVRVKGLTSFEAILADSGTGGLGCEICKPTVAAILACTHNDKILKHATLQDTNDRFLANIQRQGTYSIVPRVAGGEITPEKLIVLGQVGKKYNLYTKITGGQRIDLFGARIDQLPEIWEELIAAGFESGHAYGKALRTVKSCVGSTWCRYGVQDSVGFAIRVENRYKGIRAPHKLKSAVSGCIRECAEAQSKDFGIIATDKGWSLYLCGNGGSQPRHADLFASDLDEETCIKYIDRFLMYYIRTADRLQRTARWLEQLEGGLAHLREVIIDDKLGICAQLEADMAHLVNTYHCEWKEAVTNPELRAQFRQFANSTVPDESLEWHPEREQRRPTDWGTGSRAPAAPKRRLKLLPATSWVDVGSTADFVVDGGRAVRYGAVQLAVFHLKSENRWYATQNICPHKRDMVLSRGIVGDSSGIHKVACPQHKKTFSLETGKGLNDPDYNIRSFPAKVEGDRVMLLLPDEATTAALIQETCDGVCDEHETAAEAQTSAAE